MNMQIRENEDVIAALSFSLISDIAAQLRDLRSASQKSRYHGGAIPELPSRELMINIVSGLVAALYPRHFGPARLTAENTDAFVADRLGIALRLLQGQILKELQLAANGDQRSDVDHDKRAYEIASEFGARLPKIRKLLDTDIRAAYAGDPAAKSIDEVVFCYPGIAAIIRHRLAHEVYLLGSPLLARIISEIAHAETGIDIHPGAQIGESFFIDHGTGVVIGETSLIGRHVRLYQTVTLGAKRFEVDERGALAKNYPRHPIVEDDVVVYAGATILGRITIGRGSTIGGNVWLTESVPPGSIITQAKARTEVFDGGSGI